MPAPSEAAERERGGRRRGLLYGRRKGPKLSAHRAALFETLLPRLKLDPRRDADPRIWFDSCVTDLWLEIGFGAGEHLLWQAQHHPDVGIIGAEPYEAGVAKLLSKLFSLSSSTGECWGEEDADTGSLSQDRGRGKHFNIRVYQGDARDVIEALADCSLGRLFILFPDPWPKKRHHKRRFIQTGMLDEFARVLKPGAELRFASDDPGYVEWALEQFLAHRAFEWDAQRARDWRTRAADWPPTRYEEKALRGAPVFLGFRRRHLQIPVSRRR
ncbi:MAG TPA: tRNA (guanine(46)-N(7))-methyltransferase TrmB [Rhizomicrobium sp.]|nr:tRNA (guanine(46)-N(7))-methyltransferase TrmB [Rhizomicrobium sp.]